MGLTPKVPYWGENIGCRRGIRELYGVGTGSLGVKFLNGDLGGSYLWPHSGPPTEEVVEKEKQTGVVVRVLACLSLARTVLFVVSGVVGFLPKPGKNVSRRSFL